jgi:EAL domain-containing protein (putative c-di-GMP-specific phosphodiesterase class I)
MSYLRKLKPNRLKIDRSFIKNTPDNVEDTITTETIIALANNLKLKITAEGVETAEQLKFIEATLCDSVQGFYFSKPLTPHDFFEYLASTQPALLNSDSTPIKPVVNNLTIDQREA